MEKDLVQKSKHVGKQVVVCYLGWNSGLDMAIVDVKNIRPWTPETVAQFKDGLVAVKGKKKKRSRISKMMFEALQRAWPTGEEWANKTIEQRKQDWHRLYLEVTIPIPNKAKYEEASVVVRQQIEVEKRARRAMVREDALAKAIRKHRKREQARRKVEGWGCVGVCVDSGEARDVMRLNWFGA